MSDENTHKPDEHATPPEPTPPEVPAVPGSPPAGELIAEGNAVDQAAAAETAPPARYEGTLDEPHAAVPESGAGDHDAAQAASIAGDPEHSAVPESTAAEPELVPAAPESPLVTEAQAAVPPEATETPAVTPETPAEPEPGTGKVKKPRKSGKVAKAAATAETEADPTGQAGPSEPPASTDPDAAPASGEPAAPPADTKKKWYVVKIQSGREESIKAAIERKVKIEGLEEFFGQIAIPVEHYTEVKKVTEKKNGERVTKEKKVNKERKKYPGYLFAEVEFNDRILYLFRETSGVGDFVGGAGPLKPPPPMSEREVVQMLTGVSLPGEKKKGSTKQVVKLDYEKGDRVRIRDGAFANMEGEVKSITDTKDTGETPKVTVVVTVFGRPVDVTVDHWHVDKV